MAMPKSGELNGVPEDLAQQAKPSELMAPRHPGVVIGGWDHPSIEVSECGVCCINATHQSWMTFIDTMDVTHKDNW